MEPTRLLFQYLRDGPEDRCKFYAFLGREKLLLYMDALRACGVERAYNKINPRATINFEDAVALCIVRLRQYKW